MIARVVFAATAVVAMVGLALADNEITHYVISSGGAKATSATNTIRATLGEPVIGHAESATHSIDAGFWTAAAGVCVGDFDFDGDVDLPDFAEFLDCYTGPAGGPPEPGCEPGDGDGDGDVDLEDFAKFQGCFTGPLP